MHNYKCSELLIVKYSLFIVKHIIKNVMHYYLIIALPLLISSDSFKASYPPNFCVVSPHCLFLYFLLSLSPSYSFPFCHPPYLPCLSLLPLLFFISFSLCVSFFLSFLLFSFSSSLFLFSSTRPSLSLCILHRQHDNQNKGRMKSPIIQFL